MVVIDGGRIVYAGERADGLVTPGVEHWELTGKTIVPGLIEAHTHAIFDADIKAYIKNGVTTIRFAGLDQSQVRRVRARIEGGEACRPPHSFRRLDDRRTAGRLSRVERRGHDARAKPPMWRSG